MKRMLLIVLTVGIASAAAATLYAQEHADHQPAPAKPAAAAAQPPEVFCSTMKTGQLCSHGTTAVLGLTGEKQEAWVAAVRRYNRAVNEATMQLQKEAKVMLSAAQMAEVERWFAIGMNPQMNQLLAAPGKAAATSGGRR
jgi:hypothetical protein